MIPEFLSWMPEEWNFPLTKGEDYLKNKLRGENSLNLLDIIRHFSRI